MSDKQDLQDNIEQLGKSLRDKEARLKEGVQRELANRRSVREQQSRPA